MARIRVLIADDHAVLRAGLRMLLAAQADVEVVAEAGTAQEAVRKARDAHPDVLLLDLSMPGGGGLAAIGPVRAASPKTRIVVLTMHDDPAYFRAAIEGGASGYVVKKAADSELLSAIRAVHQGRTFADLGHADLHVDAGKPTTPGRPSNRRLSAREEEVLRLVARGYTNREIAEQIQVGVKSVETYRARLGRKLDLHRRADLIRYALQQGLLSPEEAVHQPVMSGKPLRRLQF